ncbi:MAG TPA: cytochrome P450 [Deinococcales bacterium]|nr:cytochrome P450 [Deinococcales bacterium]
MHLPDQAPALLRDGYLFAGRLRDRLPDDADPDAIRMRLLGRPALLVRGPDAVRFFTDTAVVRRHGALPGVVASVLFGQGAVHGLDDAEHLQRKAMFVTIIDAAAVHRLVASVDDAWRDQLAEWERDGAGSVYDGAVHVFGRSVLGWAGVPATPTQAQAVARDLATIVDGFGVLGPAHLKARRARHRSDTWATRLISQARTGVPEADRDSPLATVAGWRDVHGELLPVHTAAVELQNLLRPTVAVARFAAFTALALHQHPRWRERLAVEDTAGTGAGMPGALAMAFAQEVRRVSPFVPMLGALTREDLTWRGHQLNAGTRLLLDVYGTNLDPRAWPDAPRFLPERFLPGQTHDPDALVPQGGGEVAVGHRCPGEDIALGLIAVTATALSRAEWELPAQDLTVNLRRMPTMPASGVRLANVHSR